MTKRAAIYARFSTDMQDDRSIDDQVAFCRSLAARHGYEIVAVFDDRAISGASVLNREGWKKLMQAAQARSFDVVVTEDIDRLFRDQADFHTARKRLDFFAVSIHTSSGIVNRIEGSVRAMMAENMLENLAQKTRRGQAGVVRDGRHAGSSSYGYRMMDGSVRGRLAIDDEEAQIIRRIFSAYLSGKSARDIAAQLNREGVAGPRGGVWCGFRRSRPCIPI